VSLYSTALHSTTTESNSTTDAPLNKKIKKEGPVNTNETAGLCSVQFMIELVCACKHGHKGFTDIYAQSPRAADPRAEDIHTVFT